MSKNIKQYTLKIGYAPSETFVFNIPDMPGKRCTDYDYSCREELANDFDKDTRYIVIKQIGLSINRLQCVWGEIENKLHIKSKTRFYNIEQKDSMGYSIPQSGVILIKISHFWLQNVMRRSLFSLLLRVVASADTIINKKTTLLGICEQDYLTKRVWHAINHFMQGNIKWTLEKEYRGDGEFDYNGFVEEFRYLTGQSLKRRLIKP